MSSSIQANPGHAATQLSKALKFAEEHTDPLVRERALAKAEKWRAVLMGMCSGAFDFGARQPMSDVPVWATPEVITGGFVTGHLLADGPLQDHEIAILEALGLGERSGRGAINDFFISPAGLAVLGRWLQQGNYAITVPEEGALLVVAWLMEHEQHDAAAAVLRSIYPFFDRLRFYPVPADEIRTAGSMVSVQTAGEAMAALNRVESSRDCLAQSEMIRVWIPLMDRLVDMLLETVEGDAPNLARGDDGLPLPVNADRRFPIVGGWPLKIIPPGWAGRVAGLLDEYERLRKDHCHCQKPDRREDNFRQLRDLLSAGLPDMRRLNQREAGRIRLILARYLAKHGQPGSEQRLRLRECQAREVAVPLHSEIAKVVAKRLEPFPKDEGIVEVSGLLTPVTCQELSSAIADRPLPGVVAWKIARAEQDTIPNLVTKGILTSGESLALILPRITSEVQASGIVEQSLRRLFSDIYQAFRKRRSLLLLNLQSQVRLEELPWVSAVEPWRVHSQGTRRVAATVLQEIASVALSSFPQTVVPNRLVRELAALSKAADLDLPLVEEIAADIFMGEFGPKFLRASQAAAGELQNTLYQTYYHAEFADIAAMTVPKADGAVRSWGWWNMQEPGTLDQFSQLCTTRAHPDSIPSWSVAANGKVIEQQQILTTQNLSVLVRGLDLKVDRRAAARHCWQWMLRRMKQPASSHHARLILTKNAAYAWRQMVYFLAGLAVSEQRDFAAWARHCLSEGPGRLQRCLVPCLTGLERAIEGLSPDAPPEARLFLGWTAGGHWLVEQLSE